MPIDLSLVNWGYVAILSVLAFVAALLGSLISFRNRLIGAIIAGILFAVGFVFWTYYPHENIPGPISPGSTTPAATPRASTSPAPTPAAPTAPAPTTPAPTPPEPTTAK
jgi:hypothetical protein